MELKTKLHHEEGKQEILITRVFEIPVHLLFQAYTTPEIVAEWMGTQVIQLENKAHGSYRFLTTDLKGNQHGFNGVIHEYVVNHKITRTFEMENSPFPVQLEFLEFHPISDQQSKLEMKIIYKSTQDRDAMLKLPFAYGLGMAHNRIEEILLKQNKND